MITWTRELGRGMYAVEQLVLANVSVHTRTAPTARRSFIVFLRLEKGSAEVNTDWTWSDAEARTAHAPMRETASFRRGWLAALLATALALAPARASAEDAPKAEIIAPVQLDASPVPYPEGATGEAVVV